MEPSQNPDINWYLSTSRNRGVTPRCPFASTERCPRYYQSLSALGRAKISVELTASEDNRLHQHWEKSELWPKSEEDSTYMFGNGEKYHSFSNLCPEVAYERFGYFARQLVDYYDAEERYAAHQRHTEENCPTESWQWKWASLTPLHFTECPLYSPLIHAASAAKQQPKDSIESAAMPTLKEPERITLAEGLTILQQNGLSAEEGKARLRQAFVRKAFPQAPLFAFEYDEADIDWTTGFVKIPRKKERFCPTFSRSDFQRYFFEDQLAPPSRQTEISAAVSVEDILGGRPPFDELGIGAVQQKLKRDATPSRKIFVVHGHDEGAREAVARFLEKIGFEVLILHEQTDQGQTLIEKFEANADVGFVVVLLTPDDEGGKIGNAAQKRARQNVILEWGYFIGRLGRKHVCALMKGNVELPSDILGIVWKPFDEHGAWKSKLAKELEGAGFSIDWPRVGRS
jgi:Predicted nucleotide-binding protein containing TIR-like domain